MTLTHIYYRNHLLKADFVFIDAANLLSSGASENDINDVLKFARHLIEKAQTKRDELKNRNFPLWCGGESCSGDSRVMVRCVDCEEEICGNLARECYFDDGCGGEGCGELVCGDCYQTPECEREVGGCQSCFEAYYCPDCDSFWLFIELMMDSLCSMCIDTIMSSLDSLCSMCIDTMDRHWYCCRWSLMSDMIACR